MLAHWAQCLFDTACRIDGVRTVLGGRVLPRAWVRHADAGGTSASLLPTQKLVELIQCRHSDGITHIGLTSSKAGPALSTSCEPTIGQCEYPAELPIKYFSVVTQRQLRKCQGFNLAKS